MNLILLSFSRANPQPHLSGEQLKKITEFFIKKSPLTFDDLIEGSVINEIQIDTDEDRIFVSILRESLPQIAKIYKPSQRYFVSFSKEPNEPLMWSHYANKHYGFCLIFKPINGCIKQFEFRKKKQVRFKTPNSFAEEMSYSFPNEFKLVDIDYTKKVV